MAEAADGARSNVFVDSAFVQSQAALPSSDLFAECLLRFFALLVSRRHDVKPANDRIVISVSSPRSPLRPRPFHVCNFPCTTVSALFHRASVKSFRQLSEHSCNVRRHSRDAQYVFPPRRLVIIDKRSRTRAIDLSSKYFRGKHFSFNDNIITTVYFLAKDFPTIVYTILPVDTWFGRINSRLIKGNFP